MSEDKDPRLVEAEIAKAEAEARKNTAEALKLEREAETQLEVLRVSRNEADINDLRRKRVMDDENAYRARDSEHRVYRFMEEVNEKTVAECMAQLTQWSRLDPGGDMEIVYSSPGGFAIPGMALFDYIRTLRDGGHKITTGALGYAASQAGILLQAGNLRWMGREAYILVHEVSAGAIGKMGEIEDEVAFLRLLQSRMLGIFADRTKLTKAQLERKWKRKDWWLDSSEALKLGFVDEIRG